MGCDLWGKDIRVDCARGGNCEVETGSGKREERSPWLRREEWVVGCLQEAGQGGAWGCSGAEAAMQVPSGVTVFQERKYSGQGWGAWLTYHPLLLGCLPLLHHLPGWPWGFIMGVSEPPPTPLPHDSCSAPTFRFCLGALGQEPVASPAPGSPLSGSPAQPILLHKRHGISFDLP